MGVPPTPPGANAGRILIVDDDASARSALAQILTEEGYAVETASDAFRALAKLDEFGPDLVLTDLKMPGMDGLGLLRKLREDPEGEVAVVVMTAFGAIESAVLAVREGATDYLSKPLNTAELLVVLQRALEGKRLRREAKDLRNQLQERYRFENIIGSSPEMQQVFKSVAQVAPSRATVLVTGESGTGKELVAAALHHRSPRAQGPFVRLHCAALAETLLESELFGHERGAFTGADRRREGRFEQAHGGSLFLDEIGEISLSTQVKLLRVLQERSFERVGGNQALQVDVRVIAATNRDLRAMVAAGQFREDLYYRLNVINIQLPPLRRRPSDITALAEHFMRRFSEDNAKNVTQISDAALALLVGYSWPGNVRELENVIERAVVLGETYQIDPQHLPTELAATTRKNAIPLVPGSSMAELERYAILKTLEAVGGSTTRAAEMLGISVRKVQYKLQQYGAAPKSSVPALRLDAPEE